MLHMQTQSNTRKHFSTNEINVEKIENYISQKIFGEKQTEP